MRVIDEEAMSKLKILDINNPPTKVVPHQEFPKMIYLHPKDKSQEHKVKVVNNQEELDVALKAGWKTKPHIQVIPPAPELDDFEAEPLEVKKSR